MDKSYRRKIKTKLKSYAFNSVSAVLGQIEKGCEIFSFNKGQFFLIDIVAYILNQIGSAHIDIITWAIGNETIDKLVSLQRQKKIESIRIIIDYSYKTMHPDYCLKLRKIFGDDTIRVAKNHAKIIIIRNSEWNISIRSSMNLNVNRRMEYIEISDDKPLADFFTGFIDEWFMTKATGLTFDSPAEYHGENFRKFGKKNDDEFGIDMDNFDIDFSDFSTL